MKLGSHKPMNGETVLDRYNLSKTQNLMMAAAYDYKGLRVIAYPRRPLMGPNMIHGPTDQKTVSQHPGRFWTLTCFDDSR